MNRKKPLHAEVLAALAAADRKRGWNSRSRDVQRFVLGYCALYVVPFRCWAYRRQEQQAAAWWRARRGDAGQA